MWRSLIAACAVGAALSAGHAQEAPLPRPVPPPAAEAVPADDMLDAGALDDLVAPVALYPDALLAQVLVAATVPLDVMKADRFLDDNAALADKERADAAAAEGWDESVAVLAGGFPDVIRRMAEDIDWTEALGDAMVAQTDDVFDAVQRMRARAEAAGNLESNEAQTVEADGEAISIAPADSNVVYVPSYDPVAAYTSTGVAPVTGTTGTLLTAGAVAFGTSMIVDAIFDDDDDWDDYWRGPPVIHWDEDDFRPRPDIDIDGDVNIDVDRQRERRERIGDRVDGNGGTWKPTPEQRAAAKERIGDRQGTGADARPSREAVKARSNARDVEKRLESGGKRPDLAAKKPAGGSALAREAGGRPHADRAASRGADSLKRDHAPQASRDRAQGAAKAKQVSRPAHAKAPQRAAPAKRSALEKHGGGSRAKAASARGHGHAKRRR